MEDELSLDNILSEEQAENLFVDEEDQSTEKAATDNEENKENNTTTEVNAEELFADTPESRGSEEDTQEQENADVSDSSDSPNPNFYSSIATALRDEGILPDLDEKSLTDIKTPEDFAEAINAQVKSQLEDRQQRVDEALNLGVEPTEIKKFESAIQFLDTLNDDTIAAETDDGEALRKQLIFNDYVNRGYSQERANREVTKSITAGSDVEDAKEALTGNKDFYKDSYQKVINVAKAEEEVQVKQRQKQAKALEKDILGTADYDGITLDKNTRQKVLDNISKPVFKDDDGIYYTAIQKYEKENQADFMKNLGIVFTLTDGFKNLDGLVKSKVKKETKKSLRSLEHTLNNTSRDRGGNLQYTSGVDGGDAESHIGFKLDV